MKRLFIFIISFLLVTVSSSFGLAWLAGISTNEFNFQFHSPVDTYWWPSESYMPIITFETKNILNSRLRLGLVGNFCNAASFSTISDNESDKNFNEQSWKKIEDVLEVRIGYRMNSKVELNFMLGGGVNFNSYYRMEDKENNHITEKIDGYSLIRGGFGLKLNSALFNDKMYFFFTSQYFEFWLNGNGSIAVEQFKFGNIFFDWWNDIKSIPNETYSWDHDKDSYFKYFGFKSWGASGICVPLNRSIGAFSNFDAFEFKIEIDHTIAYRHYFLYEYYIDPALRIFNIKTHFDPTTIGIMTVFIFRPIWAVEIHTHYRIGFTFVLDDWVDYDNIEYKNFQAYILHDIEITGIIRFIKVVDFFKIGVKYWIRHDLDYQYMNDNEKVVESYGECSSSTPDIKHHLMPMLEIGFKLIERQGTKILMTLSWDPRIILYDFDKDRLNYSYNGNIDTNIANLANWKFAFIIQYK
ncbi:MAG: hypothetical protein KAT05_11945 [Spirochaetes bacterium]|nr:hypothetical protein [Spirochaetota bacterium]